MNPFRYIAVHEIAQALGEVRSKALPFSTLLLVVTRFHFLVEEEKERLGIHGIHLVQLLKCLLNSQSQSKVCPKKGKYLLNDLQFCYMTTLVSDEDVNNCRRNLFTKGRSIENIPPTKVALKEHIRRAIYQAGHIWG